MIADRGERAGGKSFSGQANRLSVNFQTGDGGPVVTENRFERSPYFRKIAPDGGAEIPKKEGF